MTYRNGLLVQGATRGDGTTGEDVTPNLRTVRTIPLRLPPASDTRELEVRGEVLMFRRDFEALNQRQREVGEKEYVNPRNAAAGALRGLTYSFSPTSRWRWFSASKSRRNISTSPRTSSSRVSEAGGSRRGIVRTVRRLGVTSSPVVPSPRVAPCTSSPLR